MNTMTSQGAPTPHTHLCSDDNPDYFPPPSDFVVLKLSRNVAWYEPTMRNVLTKLAWVCLSAIGLDILRQVDLVRLVLSDVATFRR